MYHSSASVPSVQVATDDRAARSKEQQLTFSHYPLVYFYPTFVCQVVQVAADETAVR